MFVTENGVGTKITLRAVSFSGSDFFFPADVEDGQRICPVFRNGIKTGQRIIATYEFFFSLMSGYVTYANWDKILRHEW